MSSPAASSSATRATPAVKHVVLAGNPNSGKTTLFNALTGLRAKVGNYPGVTVERRVGPAKTPKREIEVLDIPGCYSLVARTGEEQIAVATLAGLDGPRPEAVIVCVDATQVARASY